MTFGWSIEAAARDSRTKRSRNAGPRPAAARSASARPVRSRSSCARAVDDAHAAAAGDGLDAVAGEDVAWSEVGHVEAVQARTARGRAVRRPDMVAAPACARPVAHLARPRGASSRPVSPRRSSRRRLRLPPPVVTAAAAAAPVALCVAVPRGRARATSPWSALQMWAYIADLRDAQRRPRGAARAGARRLPGRRSTGRSASGELPRLRLQRRWPRRGAIRPRDQVLVWCTGSGSRSRTGPSPTCSLRHRDRFPRARRWIYAVFDLGVIVYWALPTAPPWYAAEHGRAGAEHDAALRRMMVEHGEAFWKERWQPLYSFLGGNPLAAMPSLHFATSVMAAHLLADVGPGRRARSAGPTRYARVRARVPRRALRRRPARRRWR